jgi:DedD protein
MASRAASEAIEIRRRGRRRLVGAIAIVALLVVFVPMLLDSEPKHELNEPAMQIPSPDKAPPLPPPAPAGKVAPSEITPIPSGAPPAGGKPAPSPIPSAGTAAAVPVDPAAGKLNGFAVQVGAYRDDKTLGEARAKLAAAGIVHYTERLEGSQAGLTRLRAGPFPTREAAEKAKATLKGASLDGQVVPLP